MTDLREKIARAIDMAAWSGGFWDGLRRVRSLKKAEAAIAAIEGAGFVVVPAEPTEEMVEAMGASAATDVLDPWRVKIAAIYRAMLAARPKP